MRISGGQTAAGQASNALYGPKDGGKAIVADRMQALEPKSSPFTHYLTDKSNKP